MNAGRKLLIGATVVFVVVGLCYAAVIDQQGARKKKLDQTLEMAGKKKKKAEVTTPHDDPSKPAKLVIEDRLHDLGDVAPDTEVTHRFTIRNEGAGPLKVRIASQTCKCTLGKLEKEVLLKGEQAKIELTFKARGTNGDFGHGVVLATNDPEQPQVSIGLTGRVRHEFWADPSPIVFTNLGPKEARSQEVFLTSGAFEAFEIVDFLSSNPGLKVETPEPLSTEELAKQEVKSGYRVKVTYTAEAKGGGDITFVLRQAGQVGTKKLELPFHATRSGIMTISGDARLDEFGEISLGNVPHGEGLKITFNVKARGEKKHLELKNLIVEPPFLKVSLEPVKGAEQHGFHHLQFEIPKDAPEGNYQGKFSGKIELEFTDPEYKKVTLVPSFAIVADKE